MLITVKDLIQIPALKSLELLAGKKGLQRKLEKVGILDYEFTARGASQSIDGLWSPGEFVITTFLYAKDNPSFIFDAIKKLNRSHACGLAIKNIFSIKISEEVLRYANDNDFPIFIFSDNSLFFEDVIIQVNNFIKTAFNSNYNEQILHDLINTTMDKVSIKKKAIEINCWFKNNFIIAYFLARSPQAFKEMPRIITHAENKESTEAGFATIKYNHGFFHVIPTHLNQATNAQHLIDRFIEGQNIKVEDYCIGISTEQSFLTSFQNALLESYYGAQFAQIRSKNCCAYEEIGVYQLLFHIVNQEWCYDYYHKIIEAIIDFDVTNKTNILDTIFQYEECHGNIKATANALFTHENTVRYRIKKASEILDMDGNSGIFQETLMMAIKLYRIKMVQNTYL